MLKQEFTARVGEQYSSNFSEANLLYMALPNADKDVFCALWKFEKETGVQVLEKLRTFVNIYEEEKRTNALFELFCRPFHESSKAYEIEGELVKIAEGIKKAAPAISKKQD